jgi:hypothetical protein
MRRSAASVEPPPSSPPPAAPAASASTAASEGGLAVRFKPDLVSGSTRQFSPCVARKHHSPPPAARLGSARGTPRTPSASSRSDALALSSAARPPSSVGRGATATERPPSSAARSPAPGAAPPSPFPFPPPSYMPPARAQARVSSATVRPYHGILPDEPPPAATAAAAPAAAPAAPQVYETVVRVPSSAGRRRSMQEISRYGNAPTQERYASASPLGRSLPSPSLHGVFPPPFYRTRSLPPMSDLQLSGRGISAAAPLRAQSRAAPWC